MLENNVLHPQGAEVVSVSSSASADPAGAAVVKGYAITNYLKECWEKKLQPFLFSVLTGDSNDAANQQLARLTAAYVLAFVDPSQPYGIELFDRLNMIEPHFAFEGVVLRNNPQSGRIEIYLMKRSDDDTAYPGEYHCPGSAARNGENWWSVAHRLGKGEFKTGVKTIQPLHEAGFWYKEKRGWYYSLPVMVELETEPTGGKWYPVDGLPENTVHHHRDLVIPPAVAYFKNRELFEAGRYLQRVSLGLEMRDPDKIKNVIVTALGKIFWPETI